MATTSSDWREEVKKKKKKKEGLGWIEWVRGWFYVVYEMLFQRIMATHLQTPCLCLPSTISRASSPDPQAASAAKLPGMIMI